jgi:hypothetical protein
VRCGARALNYQGVVITTEVYERFVEEPPLLKRDWKPLAQEFSISYIVADKRYLATMPTVVGWTYDFSGLPIVADGSIYTAYAVPAEMLRGVQKSEKIAEQKAYG